MVANIVAIAGGGALGSVLRYLMATGVQKRVGLLFPLGTLAVNVLGCLVIGLLFVWLVERSPVTDPWRSFWLVGVLGGYTTFSAFSLETVTLIEHGQWGRAMIYVVASVVLCLAATVCGFWLARQVPA